jgi:hypothetical protein
MSEMAMHHGMGLAKSLQEAASPPMVPASVPANNVDLPCLRH